MRIIVSYIIGEGFCKYLDFLGSNFLFFGLWKSLEGFMKLF